MCFVFVKVSKAYSGIPHGEVHQHLLQRRGQLTAVEKGSTGQYLLFPFSAGGCLPMNLMDYNSSSPMVPVADIHPLPLYFCMCPAEGLASQLHDCLQPVLRHYAAGTAARERALDLKQAHWNPIMECQAVW